MVAPQPASAQNCLYCPGLAPNYDGGGGGGQAGGGEAFSNREGTERTVEMWFKTSDASSGVQTLFESGDGTHGFNVYLYDGKLYAGAWADSTDAFNNHWLSTSTVETGTWHHMAYVLDANSDQAMLYHDGELVASGSPGAPLPAHPSDNGYGQVADTTKFHDSTLSNMPDSTKNYVGMIDQVRIWRGVLSQREVRSRMHRQLWNTKYDEQAYASGGDFEGGTLSDTLNINWPYNASSAESIPGWGYVGVSGRGVADFGIRYAPAPEGDLTESNAPVTTGYLAGKGGLTGDTTGTAGFGPAKESVEVTVSATDTALVSYFGDPNGTPISVSSSAAQARLNVGWSMTGLGTNTGGLTFASGDITFDFSNIGNVQDASAVKLLMREGPDDSWTDVTSNWTRDADNMTFTNASEVTVPLGATVEFAVGGQQSNLPVELTSFTGTQTDRGVRLTWQTASETNNAGFQVQRKAENGWTNVSFVDSKAQGGSTERARAYRFTDSDLPFAADELTYRLKQIDLDGSSSYSGTVTIDRTLTQLQIGTYPNPVRNQATVNFGVPEQKQVQNATLRLYNALGQTVQTIRTNVAPGQQRHSQELDVSGLSSGVYFLRLEAGGDTATQRITVVR